MWFIPNIKTYFFNQLGKIILNGRKLLHTLRAQSDVDCVVCSSGFRKCEQQFHKNVSRTITRIKLLDTLRTQSDEYRELITPNRFFLLKNHIVPCKKTIHDEYYNTIASYFDYNNTYYFILPDKIV